MSTINDHAGAQQLDYDDGQCAICLLPHTNKSRLICGHVFCFKCILVWSRVKLECPMCKQRFNSCITRHLEYSSFQQSFGMHQVHQLSSCNPQHLEVIPLTLSIIVDANTADMLRFRDNTGEYLRGIIREYQLIIPRGTQVLLDFIFRNVSNNDRPDLVVAIEQAAIEIGMQLNTPLTPRPSTF